MLTNTIAAIATPLATGGVSMIRISGDQAIAVAQKIFCPLQPKISLEQLQGYQAAYGNILNESGQLLDDGVVLVFRAPRSYTGEDVVEISCHGGVYITREILRAILKSGARMAEPGEFSKRAFLNGKMNLTQAESIMDFIQSQNAQALKSARSQMDGALFQKISAVKQTLLQISAHLAAWVDYPEEDIEEIEQQRLLDSLSTAAQEMERLIATFDTGKILREGIGTAIVGKPNVGKSTLMNLLSGCEKSIVTDIAGTTRDVVEECITIGNAMLRLADTAGIRQTDDVVEKYGVELAIKRIKSAELVLAVFDYSTALTEDDNRMIEEIKRQQIPAIAVVNKTDLKQVLDQAEIEQHFDQIVYTSKEDQNSLEQLADTINKVLHLQQIDTTSGMIANERQKQCAAQAYEYLNEAIETLQIGFTLDAVTVSIDYALEALLELTGERITEAVVDQVFHRFCVGK